MRQVTLVKIEISVNGRRKVVCATKRAHIAALWSEPLPLGEFLKDMADEVLDGGDTIDDGSGWDEAKDAG